MGSVCDCCDDQVTTPTIQDTRFWEETRPHHPPPLREHGVHDLCTCVAMGRHRSPRYCLAPPEGNHYCRCVFSRPGKQADCLSENHDCVCHLPDPNTVCKQHMTRTSVALEASSSCPICLTPLLVAIDLARPRLVIRLRVCGHYFHCECLKRWFIQGRRQCPLCMRTVQIT